MAEVHARFATEASASQAIHIVTWNIVRVIIVCDSIGDFICSINTETRANATNAPTTLRREPSIFKTSDISIASSRTTTFYSLRLRVWANK